MKKIIIGVILGVIAILSVIFVIVSNNDKDKDTLTKVKVAEVAHTIFYAPQYVA